MKSFYKLVFCLILIFASTVSGYSQCGSQIAFNAGASTAKDDALCSDGYGSVELFFFTSTGNYPYTWEWRDASNNVLASGTASSQFSAVSPSGRITNLSPGTYTLYTCNSYSQALNPVEVTVSSPPSLMLTGTTTNSGCQNTDGTISLTASGGTPSYTYSIDGTSYQTGSTFYNLSAGVYACSVKDAQNCTSTQNVVVNDLGSPYLTLINITNVSCPGVNDGSISVSGSGGTEPYQYSIDGVTFSTSSIFDNLISGNYLVYVKDANGCMKSNVYNITEPEPIALSVSADVSICEGNTASLSATASTGTSFYWSPSIGLSSTTGSDVQANPYTTTTYTVTATNGGCTESAIVTVTVNPLPNLTVSPSSPTICQGGSVTLTANGAFTYSWTPAIGLSNTSGATVTASPESTTSYFVTGTDMNGCSNTANVTVFVSPLPAVNASPDTMICQGENITLTASGAASYEWYESGILVSIGASFTASPNFTTTYDVIGTDVNGCSGSSPVAITVNPRPIVMTNPYVEICIDNTVNLSASGAVSYEWSPSFGLSSSTGSDVTFTPFGTGVNIYDIIGTDANGCKDTASSTITANDLPQIQIDSDTSQICFGLSVNLSGLPSDYLSYNWSSSSPNAGISSSSGSSISATPDLVSSSQYNVIYELSVTDNNGCVNSTQTAVTVNPLPLVTATSSSNSICLGEQVSLAAGSSILNTYSWSASSGNPSPDIPSPSTGINTSVNFSASGSYTFNVTGTSMNGCSGSTQINVMVNPLPAISTNVNNDVSCFGDNDASATVIVSGGGSFNYNWSPGEIITSTATGLSAGNYSVTVVDDTSGCSNSDSVTILEPTELFISTTGNNTTCGQLNGSATVNATGGVAPYTYLWSNGSTVVGASGLAASTYFVAVSDDNGCTKSTSVNIGNINGPSVASITANPASCGSTCDGSASVSVTGGTAPFAYIWNSANIQNTPNAVNLCEGNYTVQVTDANSCIVTANVQVVSVMPDPVFSGTIYIDGDILISGKVQLYKHSNLAGAFEMLATSSINPDGTYSVAGFKQGSYIIAAIPDTLIYPYAVKTYYNNKTKWHEADTIMAYCDSSKIIDINVFSMPPMAGYATISGLILNVTGGTRTSEPLPGVDVSLEEEPGSVIVASTVTDTEGKYTFANVAEGIYKIYVDIPGLGMVETYQISISGTDTLFDNKNFYVDSAGTIDVKFTGIVSHNYGNSKTGLEVYPNPYKDHTTIEFELESKSKVILEVFNIYGKRIKVIEQGNLPRGLYKYAFSAKDAGYSTGVYVLRLTVNNRIITQRLIETH